MIIRPEWMKNGLEIGDLARLITAKDNYVYHLWSKAGDLVFSPSRRDSNLDCFHLKQEYLEIGNDFMVNGERLTGYEKLDPGRFSKQIFHSDFGSELENGDLVQFDLGGKDVVSLYHWGGSENGKLMSQLRMDPGYDLINVFSPLDLREEIPHLTNLFIVNRDDPKIFDKKIKSVNVYI